MLNSERERERERENYVERFDIAPVISACHNQCCARARPSDRSQYHDSWSLNIAGNNATISQPNPVLALSDIVSPVTIKCSLDTNIKGIVIKVVMPKNSKRTCSVQTHNSLQGMKISFPVSSIPKYQTRD